MGADLVASTVGSVMIETAIARAGQLAALPEVALEVMRVADDPAATGEDLSRVLSRDLVLSARVLKIVNSAYYGVRREVTSIGTAVALLGFGAVKSIAIAASLTKMFKSGTVGTTFEARELWKHSVAVATASRLLAGRVSGVEPSEAFLAGLMHDIGIIIELQACREGLSAVIDAVDADPTLSFRDAELRHLAATHESFGAALCVSWRFPAVLQRVTGFHHQPMSVPGVPCVMTAIVHVADHLAATAEIGYTRTVERTVIEAPVLALLSLTNEMLEGLSAELLIQVAEVLPLFGGEA